MNNQNDKQQEITKTIEEMNYLIKKIIDCINEIDSYKCMLVIEQEKLKKLKPEWNMINEG